MRIDETKACTWVIKSGPIPGAGEAVLRCSSLAVKGSEYCPIHIGMRRGVKTKPPVKPQRDLNADVLPWSERDRAIFNL